MAAAAPAACRRFFAFIITLLFSPLLLLRAITLSLLRLISPDAASGQQPPYQYHSHNMLSVLSLADDIYAIMPMLMLRRFAIFHAATRCCRQRRYCQRCYAAADATRRLAHTPNGRHYADIFAAAAAAAAIFRYFIAAMLPRHKALLSCR